MTAIISTELLKERYEQGATLRDLAAQTGLSFQAVHQRLQRHGVEFRPMHPRLYYEQPCAVCSKPFLPRNANHYTCSLACGNIAKQRGYKAYCKRGHLLVEDNMSKRYSNKSRPRCKECHRIHYKAYWQRKKAKDETTT